MMKNLLGPAKYGQFHHRAVTSIYFAPSYARGARLKFDIDMLIGLRQLSFFSGVYSPRLGGRYKILKNKIDPRVTTSSSSTPPPPPSFLLFPAFERQMNKVPPVAICASKRVAVLHLFTPKNRMQFPSTS